MALTWQTPSTATYSSQNGSSISVNYPAGSLEGDKLVLILGMKPSTANTGSVATPTGWTPVCSLVGAGGYGTTLGADTGNTNLFVFERTVPAGGMSGSLSVTITGNNVCWGMMCRIGKALSGWNVAGVTGQDTASGNVSIVFGSDPGVTAGDIVIGAMCIPTDVSTPSQFSSEAFSQAGVTFGAAFEVEEPDSQTGNDIGGLICYASASAGTSSGPPTFTATAGGTTTNVRGPGVFIRVRETTTAHTASLSEPGSSSESTANSAGYSTTFSDSTYSSGETPAAGMTQNTSLAEPNVSSESKAAFTEAVIAHIEVVPASGSQETGFASGNVHFNEPEFSAVESSVHSQETSITTGETGFSSQTFQGASHGQTADHEDQTTSGEIETAVAAVFLSFGETDGTPDDRLSSQTANLEQIDETALAGDEQYSLAGFCCVLSEPDIQPADFREADAKQGSQTFLAALSEFQTLWEDSIANLSPLVSWLDSLGISHEQTVKSCHWDSAVEDCYFQEQLHALAGIWQESSDALAGMESSAANSTITAIDTVSADDLMDYFFVLRLASIPEWCIRRMSIPAISQPAISVELNL